MRSDMTTDAKLMQAIAVHRTAPQSVEAILKELHCPDTSRQGWWWDYLSNSIQTNWDALSQQAKLVAMLCAAEAASFDLLALD